MGCLMLKMSWMSKYAPFIVIVLLSFAYYHDYIGFSMTQIEGTNIAVYSHSFFFNSKWVSQGVLPLWNPHIMGGMPHIGNPQAGLFHIGTLLAVFLPFELSLNLTVILHMMMAGIFMYLLGKELKFDNKAAFISAFIWMFNSYFIVFNGGQPDRSKVILFIPLIFLFFHRAFREKMIVNSCLAGFFLALSFLGGGTLVFIFVPVIFVLYAFFRFFNGFGMKPFYILFIAFLVMFGVSAVKVLPMLEFSEDSSKGSALAYSFERSVGSQSIKVSHPLDILLLPVRGNSGSSYSTPTRISLVGGMLLLLSLVYIKKRDVFFLWLLLIFGVLIITGSPLYWLFWKFVPGFDKIHSVWRHAFLFVFPACLLVGYGCRALFKRLSFSPYKIIFFVFTLILAAIFLELVLFNPRSLERDTGILERVEANELMQYLADQEGLFRIHNIRTDRMGGFVSSYAVPLDLELLFGGNSIWIPRYYAFLSNVQFDPALVFGLLNVKYIYSNESINIAGLTFVKKFDECEICIDATQDGGVDGTYLYENDFFTPRSFVLVNDSIYDMNIFYPNPNRGIVLVDVDADYLYLSEKFAMFGWRAFIDGEEIPVEAIGIMTKVKIDNKKGELVLVYSPLTFRIGLGITISTLLIILFIFILNFSVKKLQKGEKSSTVIALLVLTMSVMSVMLFWFIKKMQWVTRRKRFKRRKKYI